MASFHPEASKHAAPWCDAERKKPSASSPPSSKMRELFSSFRHGVRFNVAASSVPG